MNAKETLNKVKTLLGLQVALESMKLDNGTVLEAEMFEPQYEVFIVSGEDRVALPVGEYTLEDGRILAVAEEGVIAEIKEATTEEEKPIEEDVTEPEMQAEVSTPKKVVESISKEMFFSEIEKLRNEILELKSQKEEVVEVELSAEVEPIVHNPEAKPERELKLFSQKQAKTTKQIVFNKLFNN